MARTQTYQYDGFGNLTAKVLNGTTTAIAVNAATNQLTNAYYYANGNMTSGAGGSFSYDEANRLVAAQEPGGGSAYYAYNPSNKRVYQWSPSAEEFTFYGACGEKLGMYTGQQPSPCYYYGCISGFTPVSTSMWFAGRLLTDSGNPVVQGRLGTNRVNGARFMPYGDEITSTSNDREKFATYTRDSYTGLDYADQRMYASTYGRFTTPDLHAAGAATSGNASNPSDPGSWNLYAFGGGDPVNRLDPTGLDWIWIPDQGWCSSLDPDGGCYDPGGDSSYDCGIQANQFNPAAAAWCMSESAEAASLAVQEAALEAAAAAQQTSGPSCCISLDQRPVPNIKGTPGVHTYLTVTDSDWANDPNGVLIEGGPSGNPVFSSLVGYDTQAPGTGLGAGTPNASDPSLPSNIQIGGTYGGALACGAVQYLLNQVDSYDQGKLATYNFLAIPGTYNSNSFTYTLINDLNSVAFGSILSAFGSQVPGWAPGWGKSVPGL